MSWSRVTRCLLIGVVGLLAQRPLRAESPAWANPGLQPREGLVLWLDASCIAAARKEAKLPDAKEGKPLDVWLDASGNGRSASQPSAATQPTLMQVEGIWFFRFDGEDDHFRSTSGPAEASAVTVLLVAAPHRNPGDFRGLFAANAPHRRDYESGLCIDLGPGPTGKFDQLNVEGHGFGGARDLRQDVSPFGTLHVLETVIDPAAKTVRLAVDGQAQGERPYGPGSLSLEQLTIGARFYTNGPGDHIVRGPIAADIAEVIVYDRVLSAAETSSVRTYLTEKYAKLKEALPQHLPQYLQEGVPLVKVENPPPVQLLVPGFTVRELPVQLTNLDNVRYREDGKLVTLGYNGDIHLVTDTNGDGLEDHAEIFFKNNGSLRGPIGMELTPPDYPKGRGVFVASKGKVSLIVDTNGDDKADEEIVVASGWKEIPQNVDAVGMAMDKEGNLFFGLGTANYANAYLIDDQGKAAYDLQSDRGTVQKVSADFSKRETVCTGIRFPIAFAFNEHGDLFCTEQEGATWLPNGNPFDELLHIQQGRHYGFPPRHPRHNPDVLDEPSTFDYGPQHQSTCGMVFNESVNGGPSFGPAWWQHNALVCGESRGKIWRTQLVQSSGGYVASTQLIACLQMLTVDCCVAPNGDLVVACHSGPPDWGTGPTGAGKLYRISMAEQRAPRPVAIWANSPQELQVTFDQRLNPLLLRNLRDQIVIEYGEHVRAADRFEHLVPPYAVVQRQQLVPRYRLAVLGAAVSNDMRSLIINTAPMSRDVTYAVTLPGLIVVDQSREIPAEHSAVDVDFTLRGVEAEWKDANGNIQWSGWLPHLELQVCRELLRESTVHAPLWDLLKQPGMLMLKSQVDLTNILRPAIQPGAVIDYAWPKEMATLTVKATQQFELIAWTAVIAPNNPGHANEYRVTGETVSMVISLPTGPSVPHDLTVSVRTNEDKRPRPLPLRRFLLPWVQRSTEGAPEVVLKIAEIEGGSWGRGRRVFHSEAAGCFKCHSFHGNVGRIGPDLNNLVHRDYASVMRDIVTPSFAINPDHIGHLISLKDGRVLTGVLRTEEGELLLGDAKGEILRLRQSEIEEMQPATESIMPKGLLEKLSAEQVKDLMTYLLTPPPSMPLESPLPAPPLRTQAEVAAALAEAPTTLQATRPLNIVLVAGPKDHGPGEHDYPAWQRNWLELLTADESLTVSQAWEFPSEEQLEAADILIFFQKGSFETPRPEKLDAFLKRGGGAVYIHWAVNGNDEVQGFSDRIGLASWGGKIKFRHGPLSLDIHNTDHPIVRNFDKLDLYDESYWLLTGKPENVTLLATSREDDMPTPQLWVVDHKPGRVFVSIPGHYSWTFDDPLFRIILLRGIAWTANQPVDRFNSLVPLGARMSR